MIRRLSIIVLVLFAVLSLWSTVTVAQSPLVEEGQENRGLAVCSEPTSSTYPQKIEQAPTYAWIVPRSLSVGDTNLIPSECQGLSGDALCECMCAWEDPACWVQNC